MHFKPTWPKHLWQGFSFFHNKEKLYSYQKADILELENLRQNWPLISSASEQIVLFLIVISIYCSATAMLFLRTVEWSCIQKSLCRRIGLLSVSFKRFNNNWKWGVEYWGVNVIEFVTQKQGINLFFFDYLLILKWRVFALITISSPPKLIVIDKGSMHEVLFSYVSFIRKEHIKCSLFRTRRYNILK